MSSWIIPIEAAHPEHWNIARAHSFWDMTAHHKIQMGDYVCFWLAGQQKFLGRGLASSDALRLSPESPSPWEDSGVRSYTHRFSFTVVNEEAESQPGGFSALVSHLTNKASFQTPRRYTDPADEQVIAEYFSPDTVVLPDEERQKLLEEVGIDRRVFSWQAIAQRSGQATFRNKLLDAYGTRCAVTGSRAVAVLEAAHISPFKGDHTHVLSNGILLRSDVHTLFDLYRVTVLPETFTVRVAPELEDTEYASFDGQTLVSLPAKRRQQPDTDVLAQHNERCAWLNA